MAKQKNNRDLGAVSCILGSIALLINFLVFLILFHEQLKTGWGYSTNYEMLTLLFWMVEFCTLPLLLAEFAYVVYELFKKNCRSMLIANAVILGANVLFILFTNLFIFY